MLKRTGSLGLVVLVYCAAVLRSARADEQRTFVMPASEGYGVGECLAGAQPCGKLAADAWCNAHGLGPSLAFGLASDLTASIGAPALKADPDAMVIACSP